MGASAAGQTLLPPLGWLGILRLGLVQTALGSIVVLTTSTLNRVMVVELALPAMLPGLLVGFHYAVQVLRPRWGHGSDVGGRRTPWIVGGMASLALGGSAAALATAWMASSLWGGLVLAFAAFLLIGVGVGASGTSLLALLATRVAPSRRAAAASLVWMMMIVGFVVTATTAGHLLDPFTTSRLVAVTTGVSLLAFTVTLLAVWHVEGATPPAASLPAKSVSKPSFRETLREVWAEPKARRFTVFVFVSMLAYSAQDLILEPFAGIVFGFTPGESTKLAGLQHAGVLAGMILVAVVATLFGPSRSSVLRAWTIGGCVASALALLSLTCAGLVGPSWPLRPSVFLLGLANGAFAVAAIGSMMALAGAGGRGREGLRIGLWGAAQALAFGLGGLVGATAADVVRYLLGSPGLAYACVFAVEGVLFLFAAGLAAQVGREKAAPSVARLPESFAADRYAADIATR